MQKEITKIIEDMSDCLNNNQLRMLQDSLLRHLTSEKKDNISSNDYLNMFINTKKIEGCSDKTLFYYRTTIEKFIQSFSDIKIQKISAEVIREYLSNYQLINNCSNVTLDNIRRNISSFFTWLEQEDYIIKSPMRKIHKIKTKKVVKEIINDEDIERLRDNCKNSRDLAMLDLLYSTGIRVGELTKLKINDVNFEERECIVFGKGDKERKVYFDARTKLHLKEYLDSRKDDNKSLFVSLYKPYLNLEISGVEIRLRSLGKNLSINKVHPHKFRRTMATKAIDKGMPIEQVQKILGHSQIDTTMQYAIVNQLNVKNSHRRYLS